jgi:hypothetical protein
MPWPNESSVLTRTFLGGRGRSFIDPVILTTVVVDAPLVNARTT